MKKIFISTILLLLFSSVLFASKVEGKWEATVDTDNGPFSFAAEYVVNGEKISGVLSSEMGSVDFSDGKISGEEFEYSFYIDSSKIVHKGKWVDGKLEIKSSGDYGESEFKMTRLKKE